MSGLFKPVLIYMNNTVLRGVFDPSEESISRLLAVKPVNQSQVY